MGTNDHAEKSASTRVVDINEMMEQLHADEVILLVDDEDIVLRTIERQADHLGYSVLTATNGEEALKILESTPCAVVVADQNMPGMQGIELLQAIQKTKPETIRVLATGDAGLDVAIAAVNQGQVFRFLTKPWSLTKLEETLKAAIEQRRVLVENRAFKERIQAQNEQLKAFNHNLECLVEERTAEVREKSERILTLYADLEDSFDAMLQAMVAVTTVGEPKIAQHTQRVREMVVPFTKFLGLHPEQRKTIERAAMIHWIGLLNAPPSLFRVSINDFDVDDRIVWEFHPALGANAIAAIPTLKAVAKVVANYLERPDSKQLRDERRRVACQVLKICSLYQRELVIAKTQKRDTEKVLEMIDVWVQSGELHQGLAKEFMEFTVESPSVILEETSVSLDDLQPGMVFSRPITTGDGVPIVTRDAVVTDDVKVQLAEIMRHKDLNQIWVWSD